MRALKLFPALLLALALVALLATACGTLPAKYQLQRPPQTPVELLGWVYVTRGSVERAAHEALDNGSISVDLAESVYDTADDIIPIEKQAADLIDAGDLSTAEGRLRVAQSLLLDAQRRLDAHTEDAGDE